MGQRFKLFWGLGIFALLLFSLLGALTRLGWFVPAPLQSLAHQHGALMICGFFGTLIGLERWILKGFKLGYLSPAFTFSGALCLLFFSESWAALCFTLAALYQLLAYVYAKQYSGLPALIQMLGLCVWGSASLIWLLGRPFSELSLGWIGFLSLTILGSRLDKIQRACEKTNSIPSQSYFVLYLAILGFIGGFGLHLLSYDLAYKLCGLSFILSAMWYLKHDRFYLMPGREAFQLYFSWGLCLSYLWLALSGLVLLVWGQGLLLLAYDVYLHMVLLGFVFGMVFAHLPIILPELSSLRFRFHPILFLPLILLHGGLIARFMAIVFQFGPLFQWLGLFNILTLLSLPGTLVFLRRTQAESPSSGSS